MKINEFIKEFKAKKIENTNTVVEYIRKTLEVKNYIPFEKKRDICVKVLDTCNQVDKNGLIKVDSMSRYIVFTIAMISAYTNLEFSSGEDSEVDSVDEYDMLCEAGLLDLILESIGQEYATCNNMLNMMLSDLLENNNNIETVVGNSLRKLVSEVDDFVNVLSNKVDSLNLDLSQIDIDKYKGILEELVPQK